MVGAQLKYRVMGDELATLIEAGQWTAVGRRCEPFYITRVMSDTYILNRVNEPQLYKKYMGLYKMYKLPESIKYGFITDTDFLRRITMQHSSIAEDIMREWTKATATDYVVCDKCGGLKVIDKQQVAYLYEDVDWTNEKSNQLFNWHVTNIRSEVRDNDNYYALRVPGVISGALYEKKTGRAQSVNIKLCGIEPIANMESVLVYSSRDESIEVLTPESFKLGYTGVQWYSQNNVDRLHNMYVEDGGIRAINAGVFGIKSRVKESEAVTQLRELVQREINNIEDGTIRSLIKKAYIAVNSGYWRALKVTKNSEGNKEQSLAVYVVNTVKYVNVLLDADKQFNVYRRSIVRAVLLLHKLCAYGLTFENKFEVPEDTYLVHNLLKKQMLSEGEWRIWQLLNKLLISTRAASFNTTELMLRDELYKEHLMLCLNDYFENVCGIENFGGEFIRGLQGDLGAEKRERFLALDFGCLIDISDFEQEARVINYCVNLALTIGNKTL